MNDIERKINEQRIERIQKMLTRINEMVTELKERRQPEPSKVSNTKPLRLVKDRYDY